MNLGKEKIIDAILVYIVSQRENEGLAYDSPCFNFYRNSVSMHNFSSKYGLDAEAVTNGLNACLSRKYIKNSELGTDDFESIELTESGQARAMSVKLGINNEKNEIIDDILIFMNNFLEEEGYTANCYNFDFTRKGDAFIAFRLNSLLQGDYIDQAIKACLTREYVEQPHITRDFILRLTYKGQARARSTQEAHKHPQQHGSVMHIEKIDIHGNGQVGDGNMQNISNVFYQLQEQVKLSDAPDEEKNKVLNLIKQLAEHPLICAIIGGVVGGIAGGAKQ